MGAVDHMGFEDRYDFLYLPKGGRSSKVGRSNLGYGFINFLDPHDAAHFAQLFQEFLFEGPEDDKVCTVRPAHVQGLVNNLYSFSRSVGKHRARGLLVCPVVRVIPGQLPADLKETLLQCLQCPQPQQSPLPDVGACGGSAGLGSSACLAGVPGLRREEDGSVMLGGLRIGGPEVGVSQPLWIERLHL